MSDGPPARDPSSAGDPAAVRVRPPWLAVVLGIVLVAVAIWEIVATRQAATSVPDDAAWRRAAAVVRAGHQPGDLVVFAPGWVDPTGRLHLGDLIPIEMAARMDAARYGRIWELSIRGARAPETAGLAPVFAAEEAGIAIRRFERTPVTVLADVRAWFGPEAASKPRVDGPAARPPVLELAEVGFAPRRCVQVVPVPGKPVRITLPLPAGTLVGYAGLADVFTRRDIRAPGTLEVEVAGAVVASVSPGVDDGWVRFEAPVPAGDVTFVARAAAPNRLICFAAEVRR